MLKERIDGLKTRFVSRKVIFITDLILSVAASAIVLLVENMVAKSVETYAMTIFLEYIITSALSSVLLIFVTKSYQIVIRHLTVRDLVPFGIVSLGKALILLAVISALGSYSPTLTMVTMMDFLLTFVMLVGVRVLAIIAYGAIVSREKSKFRQQRLLVYGISEKSVAAVPRLQNSTHYSVVGFLTRGKEKDGTRIEQRPVFGFETEEDFRKILQRSEADAVLFAKDSDVQLEDNALLSWCSASGVKTLIIPIVDEMVEGQTVLHPREIKVEDLLGRQEIKINMEAIQGGLNGKVVMVTGAAGSIGSELCRQIAGFGVKKLVLYDNAETPVHNLRLELEKKFPDLDFVPMIGDVRQEPRLDYAFRGHHPQIVFHAAAYKHVPLMEENPCEAVLVNVLGSRQVADKCIQYGVEKMVMISTDKAVNPTNVMGCTKRLAEIYVQSLGLAVEGGKKPGKTVFVTTRFGNVLGSNGSVIPRFREQIAAGGPVTVTHPKINRYFMTIPEACRLVMEAATMATATTIFVFDMGKPVKIDTLARKMITLAGFVPDKDIKVEYTGLRPGEKLYEEVLSDEENTLPTVHDRIRIAKVREYDYDDAASVVNNMARLASEVKITEMVRQMKIAVPEYKSSDNSAYHVIDKELGR